MKRNRVTSHEGVVPSSLVSYGWKIIAFETHSRNSRFLRRGVFRWIACLLFIWRGSRNEWEVRFIVYIALSIVDKFMTPDAVTIASTWERFFFFLSSDLRLDCPYSRACREWRSLPGRLELSWNVHYVYCIT